MGNFEFLRAGYAQERRTRVCVWRFLLCLGGGGRNGGGGGEKKGALSRSFEI